MNNDENLPIWKDQSLPNPGEQYTDDIFPPNYNSLSSRNSEGEFLDPKNGPKREKAIEADKLKWERASNIFKDSKYLLFEDKIEPNDVNQGTIGDCYYVSSVAAMAKYPNLIYNIFLTKELNTEGYFILKFFIDGKFQKVIVDDYLPVNQKGELVFARPNKNEIWCCILEKAWAKVNGGYVNIVAGWMHEVLECFTGFPSETYVNANIKERILWEKLEFAYNTDCICTCSTKSDVGDVGLVKTHAYSILGIYKIESKGEVVRLIKLRNPYGYLEWTGDWSDKSDLWGEEEKKAVDFVKKDDGVFFMSFDDYYKNFVLTDICIMQYNAYSKILLIEGEKIKNGQVYNIFLEEDGLFSVSLLKKCYRYYRELTDCFVPCTLILMKYDPNASTLREMMTDFYGSSNVEWDASISAQLKSGYYVIYTYLDVPNSTNKNDDHYHIKIDCTSKFLYLESPNDYLEYNFPFLREMIIQGVIDKRKSEINYEKKYSLFVSEFENSGIGMRLIYNCEDKYFRYTENQSKISNCFILSPYTKEESFSWIIPPKDFACVLSLQTEIKKPKLTLTAKSQRLSAKPSSFNEVPCNIQEYITTNVSEQKIENIETYYDIISISLDKAKESLQFEKIDMAELTIDAIKKKESKLMNILLELNPVANDSDLSWVVRTTKAGKYVGQLNKNKKKEGRGSFLQKSGYTIGYFMDDCANGECKTYDTKLKFCEYEGNFVDGIKKGFGIMHYKNGDMYEGNFDNGVKNGNGKYHHNGTTWEGNFTNDEKDGEGIFTCVKGVLTVTFVKGVCKTTE